MIYYLFFPLRDRISALNVLRYISFRAGLAAAIAFLLSVFMTLKLIRYLKQRNIIEDQEEKARLDHRPIDKRKVPSMGGVAIIAATILTTLLCAKPDNAYIWITCVVMMAFGAIGFIDDVVKLTPGRKGISARQKLALQLIVGFGAALTLAILWWRKEFPIDPYGNVTPGLTLTIPFFRVYLPLGLIYVIIGAFFLAACSNATNLTDGIDGLAIGCTIIVTVALTIVCYIVGRRDFTGYLFIPYVPGAGELSVLTSALIGASLGFLLFNCPPAQVFMGDTGSLGIGAALGFVAMVCKQEIVLLFIGGIFLVELATVTMQVSYFKWTKKRTGVGKRIFKKTPIHHHFQECGWENTKITIRFIIIAAMLALLSILTLKLR